MSEFSSKVASSSSPAKRDGVYPKCPGPVLTVGVPGSTACRVVSQNAVYSHLEKAEAFCTETKEKDP